MITSFVDAFFKAFFSNVKMKFDIESLNVSQNKFVSSAVQVLDKPHNIYPHFKFCGFFPLFFTLYFFTVSFLKDVLYQFFNKTEQVTNEDSIFDSIICFQCNESFRFITPKHR